MKTKFVSALVLAATTGLALAAGYSGSGWVDVPNAAWFSQYSSILFGEGTFNYQGENTSYAGSFAVKPAGSRKIATVAVPSGTTLGLDAGGAIVQQGGLVTKGPGTLAFGGPSVSFATTTVPTSDNRPKAVSWNANGEVTGGVLGRGLNVYSGTVTVTNTTVNFGDQLFVGGLGANEDATLRIENARVTKIGGLYLNYGATNATLATPPTARFLAKNSVFENLGAVYMNRTDWNQSKAYPTGFRLVGELCFDNCIVTNTGVLNMDSDLGGIPARSTFTLDHGTTFLNRSYDSAYTITGGSNLSPTTNSVNVLNGSKLLTTAFGIDTFYGQDANKMATNVVTVSGGSTLGFMLTSSRDMAIRWSVLNIDGGTLMPWSIFTVPSSGAYGLKCNAMLFHRWDNAFVSSGGLTLDVPVHSYAYLFPAIRAGATAGGSVTVTGGGAATISPTALPIAVRNNSTLAFTPRHFLNEDAGLSMNGDHIEYDPYVVNNAVTVENGSSLRVFGRNQTLMGMTLPPCAVSFSASRSSDSISARLSTANRAWKAQGTAIRPYAGDGSHFLQSGRQHGCGDAHVLTYSNKVDLTRSFRITFEYSNGAIVGRVVRGLVAFIHNDPRGWSAKGCGSHGLSYMTNNTPGEAQVKIGKSGAVMLRTWGTQGLYFCQNGEMVHSTRQTVPIAQGDLGYVFQPDRLRPAVFTLEYDATKKVFSYAMTSPYGQIYGGYYASNTFSVHNSVSADLSAICGSSGFFGVSAGSDGGSPTQHIVSNFSIKYLDDLDRPCSDVAGTLALGSGKATLSTYGTDETAGFAMRKLTYADGGTLEVTSTNLAYGVTDPSFVAFDQWSGSGTVTKTGPGNLGVRLQNTKADLTLAEGGLVLRRDYEDPYVYSYVNRMEREWIANWFWNYRHTDVYTSDADNGVWCGTGDTGISGSTALKRRLKVSGKWTMAFDYEASQNDGAYGAFITFHNDPRGYAAITERGNPSKEYSEYYALYGKTQEKNIKSCFAINFYNYADNTTVETKCHYIKLWASDATGTFSENATAFATAPDATGNEQIYIANYTLKNVGTKVARKFHCVLAYDETAAEPLTITLTQNQDKDGKASATRTWTRKFNRNLPEIVGGDTCNFGLFYSTGGQVTRVKIKNLTFRHDDASEAAAKPYFSSVNVTAPAATVYLDGAKEYAYRLAETVNVSGGLTVKALRKSGTLDLAGARVGDGATLAADGATVRFDKDSFTAENSKIVLTNGAKLNLDFVGALQVKQIVVDGRVYKRANFDASNCSFITGTGRLNAGKGLCILIK